jgi:hypothetical protein
VRRYYYEALRQILELEVVQQAVGISIRLQKRLNIMEASATFIMKEDTSKAQPWEKEDDGCAPGPACNLSGNHLG